MNQSVSCIDESTSLLSEYYEERIKRFLERVDGAVGYRYGFGQGQGYGEQFTRWNPATGSYLPTIE